MKCLLMDSIRKEEGQADKIVVLKQAFKRARAHNVSKKSANDAMDQAVKQLIQQKWVQVARAGADWSFMLSSLGQEQLAVLAPFDELPLPFALPQPQAGLHELALHNAVAEKYALARIMDIGMPSMPEDGGFCNGGCGGRWAPDSSHHFEACNRLPNGRPCLGWLCARIRAAFPAVPLLPSEPVDN